MSQAEIDEEKKIEAEFKRIVTTDLGMPSRSKKTTMLIVVLLVIAAGVGGWFYMKKRKEKHLAIAQGAPAAKPKSSIALAPQAPSAVVIAAE